MSNKKKPNTTAVVTAIVEPIVKEAGLQLWDVLFEKEGASWFLRVYIDGKDGLTMKACEDVTRVINKALDAADPIDQSYYLEVGSPGIERKLKKPYHFECTLGKEIYIKTIRPVDNKREFVGILKAYKKNEITVVIDTVERVFLLNECAFVKLYDDIIIGGVNG